MTLPYSNLPRAQTEPERKSKDIFFSRQDNSGSYCNLSGLKSLASVLQLAYFLSSMVNWLYLEPQPPTVAQPPRTVSGTPTENRVWGRLRPGISLKYWSLDWSGHTGFSFLLKFKQMGLTYELNFTCLSSLTRAMSGVALKN